MNFKFIQIFNELQSIFMLHKMLYEEYSFPGLKPEKNFHTGMYNSINLFLIKTLASTLYSIQEYFKKNKKTYSPYHLKLMLKDVSKESQFYWEEYEKYLDNKTSSFSLLKVLERTRHEVGFHIYEYDLLKDIQSFFNLKEQEGIINDHLYYGYDNDKLEESKFFYMDAGINFTIFNLLKLYYKDDKNMNEVELYNKFVKDLFELQSKLSRVYLELSIKFQNSKLK
jgi:hypothetical protein